METATNVHWKKLTNTKYLGSQDIPRGEDLEVTIDSITTELVKSGGFDGKPLKEESCIVAQLRDGLKPLILNKTNCKTIAVITGSNYIDDWKGKSFTLYASTVRVGGEVVDALRIRNKKETKPIVSVTDVVARASGSSAIVGEWLNLGSKEYNEQLTLLKNGKTTLDEIKRKYKLAKLTEAKLISDFK
jgi:hypothetical protein